MSSAEVAVRTYLLTDAALAALVGKRIEAAPLTQGSAVPAITYQRVSAGRNETFEGPSGLVEARVQYDCWGGSYDEAHSLFEALRAAVNGKSFQAAGVDVQKVRMVTERDLPEPELRADLEVHRVSADLSVWHNEAVV